MPVGRPPRPVATAVWDVSLFAVVFPLLFAASRGSAVATAITTGLFVSHVAIAVYRYGCGREIAWSDAWEYVAVASGVGLTAAGLGQAGWRRVLLVALGPLIVVGHVNRLRCRGGYYY